MRFDRQITGRTAGGRPSLAGDTMSASDWPNPGQRVGPAPDRSAARLLTSGPIVGARTVSPSPNSAVKPNTQAIRPATGSAAGPLAIHLARHGRIGFAGPRGLAAVAD